MIDAVRFSSAVSVTGRHYEKATIWIGGLPFSVDITPHVERVVKRIALKCDIEIIDARRDVF
jgi:hypothetical protein